jgi:hypothetical protein
MKVPKIIEHYDLRSHERMDCFLPARTKIVTVQPLSLPWPPARRAYASESASSLAYNAISIVSIYII